MELNEPLAAGRPPQTKWECCLIWADLLLDVYVSTLEQSPHRSPLKSSEEEAVLYAGADRPLVSFLIAAALHERVVRLELAFVDAAFVPLAAPKEEGTTGTLRRSPYSALELSPEDEGGCSSRALLVRSALSPHPDDRLLWERVRTAASNVVGSVARVVPARHNGRRHPDVRAEGPYWERGITIADVLLTEQKRRELAQLAEVLGED